MNITKVEVTQAVKVPSGAYLDGVVLTEKKWISIGTHDFDSAFLSESGWVERGYVAVVSINGQPVASACCSNHDAGEI